MKKQLLNPDAGAWMDHESAFSDGVVVHQADAKRVFVSGLVAEGSDIATQTRRVLETLAGLLDQVDGTMDDVVRVRVYVNRPALDLDSLETVHEIRREFFSGEHLPASTLLEVEDLVRDDYLIEIDADAIIPDGEWEVEHF